MEKQIYGRIIVNPGIMAGKPVIKGTRIPVDLIIGLLAQGMTFQEILEDYPQLKKEDILIALKYVSEVVKGESVFSLEG